MQGHDEELLSAFHDGELHGDEREAVERTLAESAAARDTLEEFVELRTALQSLPRSAAPAALQSAVMRQLRAAQPLAAPPARPRGHAALRWIVPTAACLGIAVGLYSLSRFVDPARNGDLGIAHTGTPTASESAPGAFSGVESFTTMTDSVEALPPRTAAADAPLADTEPHIEVVDVDRLQALISSGELPSPGEVIPDFREIDGQLVLIEYSVVDVHEVLGQVQLILKENGIMSITPDGEVGEPVDSSDELYGIYVDAPSEQFVAAIAELDNLNGVVFVSTPSPDDESSVAMDRAEGTANTRAAPANQVAAATPAPPPPSARNSRSDIPPPPEPADRVAETAPPESAPMAPLAADAQTADPEQSYQYKVPLRRDLLAELQPDGAPPGRDRQQRQALDPAQFDGSRKSEPTAPDGDPSPAQRVRVVLVFVPSPDR